MRAQLGPWLVVLAVALAGCASNPGVSAYLQKAGQFERDLATLQTEMTAAGQRPLEQRAQAFADTAARVRARGTQLAQLPPPAPAQELHKTLLGLYDLLARYCDRAAHAGGSEDPELRALSAQWQAGLRQADTQLSQLSARYQ